MEFFVSCIPPKATSQQKGIVMINGQPRHFKKRKVKDAETTLSALLAPHRPPAPLDGPLRVSVVWTYPWRRSEPKKNRVNGFKPCDTRPDCDNLCKLLFDCMTALAFWNDDSQIAGLSFVKRWGDATGIEIEIEEWGLNELAQSRTDNPSL